MTSGTHPRPLVWMGSSKKDLMKLPSSVIDVFGFALYQAQMGKRHEHARFCAVSVTQVFLRLSNRRSVRPIGPCIPSDSRTLSTCCTCSRKSPHQAWLRRNLIWILLRKD